MQPYVLIDSDGALARFLRNVGVTPPWPLVGIVLLSVCVTSACGVYLHVSIRQWVRQLNITRASREGHVSSDVRSVAMRTKLAPGWIIKHDEDGKAYFWHILQRRATWRRPRPEEEHELAMPEGWQEHDDDQGRRYYYDTRQRSSTWTHPATRAADARRERGAEEDSRTRPATPEVVQDSIRGSPDAHVSLGSAYTATI